ncbi:ABC transporter permease [Paenibacillus turpanensis]|uniref:ABC transporter permease n=1 Tax=Paenibacillus turpanensis TaxID=2689078 RepID=UPI0014088A89|nr:ABC transporter permease [Paenibacillus turpanensis]
MNSMGTVIWFTFYQRVKTKSFWISSIIFALLIVLFSHLPTMIQKFSGDVPHRVGIVATESVSPQTLQRLVEQGKQLPGKKLELTLLPSQGSLEANEKAAADQMLEKKIDGYVVFEKAAPEEVLPGIVYKSKDSQDNAVREALVQTFQSVQQQLVAEKLGLSEGQLGQLFAPYRIDTVQIAETGGEGKSESQLEMAFILVYVLLFLLYVGVIGYGNIVATEITAEKNSRVMEVLISTVSPVKQMFGKIIGVCLVGLLQVLLFVGFAIANVYVSGNSDLLSMLRFGEGGLEPFLLVAFVVFYVLGYLIYATIFAAVGSLVSRTEEVGQAIMPVTMLIVAAFVIAMIGLNKPTAPFVVILSFVPFFSPLLMFERIGMSSPAAWEIALSIGILIVSIILLGWLAAKIYRAGVLMYGKRPSWKELWKAMRSYS